MLSWRYPADPRIHITLLNTDKFSQLHLLWHLVTRHRTLYFEVHDAPLTPKQLQHQFQEVCQEQHRDEVSAMDFLIVAECDRARPEALAAFLKEQLNRTDGWHIVLSSVVCRAAIDEDLAPVTRFWQDDNPLFHPDQQGKSVVVVRSLGQERVIVNGRLITDWRGDMTRQFFFFLINQPIVTREDIRRAFWPHKKPRAAANLFHVTRQRLKRILGVELLDHSGGYYHLSSQIHLVYDVNQFTHLIERNHPATLDEEIALLEKIIALYRGSYLSGDEGSLVENIRQRCEREYCEALARLGMIRLKQGDMDRALGLLMRVFRLHTERADVVKHLMHIYLEQDRPADALQVYRRYETHIKAATRRFRPPSDLQQYVLECEQRLAAAPDPSS